MSDTAQVQAAQLQDIARRLSALPADKRKLFVTRLEERGIEVGVLPIVAGARPPEVPLSYAQQRLWLADQLDPEAALYNLTTALRLRGPLDRRALSAALDGLAVRHEGLRTAFVSVAGTPTQVIHPPAPMTIKVTDLSALPVEERLRRARDLAAEDALTPFDLTRAPLLRAELLILAPEEHWLILTMHHLISDEWSNTILVGELIQLYDGGALATGSTPTIAALEPLAVQYADYALWQRAWLEGGAVRRQLAYWEKELANPDGGEYDLPLPTDLPRPALPTTAGAAHVVTLPKKLKERLTQLARRCDATLFMTVLAGFQILLSRWAGQREVRVGVPIANRHRPEVEGVVGFFSNTQVLRGVVRGSERVVDLLAQVRRTVLEAQANQDLPFDRVVDALMPERRAGRNPLFEVMLSWHREEATSHQLRGGLVIDWEVPEERIAKFDLCLHATDAEDGIGCELVYRTELFTAETIAKMAARLTVILDEMTRKPEQPIAALGWLTLIEQAKTGVWSAGDPQMPTPVLHEWLRTTARAGGEAIALRAGDEVITYGELERRANRLASRLLEVGVGLETRVALGLGRSVEFVVALYAVMKCGAAYVPLDAGQPDGRLVQLLADCRAVAMIATPEVRTRLEGQAPGVAWIDAGEGGAALVEVHHLTPPSATAYLLYTSGSTGQPKAVAVTHDNLSSYVQGLLDRLELPPRASMAVVSTVAADLGNTTLFGALCSGATLHLISEREAFDADAMGRLMTEHQVAVLKIVPSHLKGLLQAAQPGAALPKHTLIVGGEATDWALVEKVRALGTCRIVNHYGPTETTVGVLTYQHSYGQNAPAATLPLGKPLPGRHVYVLDADLRHLPPGVIGEIYIGGMGVARGYDGQAAMTADRFLPDPFAMAGTRMYRTGDRARRLPDGNIEFLGRGDGQIKLRGYRVELGEIRAELLAVSGSAGAEVLVTESPAGGQQLSAYLLGEPRPDGHPDGHPDVLQQLAARLPAHMVPAELVWLDRFPVTPNGKLDRRALAEHKAERASSSESGGGGKQAPRSELEQTMARIWCEALNVDSLGVHDNFFQLGGDSLLAFQVVASARAAGIKLHPRDLFEQQTVESLAAALEARLAPKPVAAAPVIAEVPLVPVSRQAPLPASYAQERLWFLWRLDPESTAYHAPIALRLSGELDAAALSRALRQLTARHEILRTRLVERDGAVLQLIGEAPDEELAVVALPDEAAAVRAHVERFASQPFDLEAGPLWRSQLIKLGEQEHLLVVVFHHVISDGWSTSVLSREVAQLYSGAAPLAELPIQYADYAAWQRRWLDPREAQGEHARQLAYWRARLGTEHPVLELPADRPRPPVQSYRGGSFELELGDELSAALALLARKHDATVFMVLLAAFNALLFRLTGQTDLRVGVPNANRHRRELDGLIGFFVNTQVLRTEVAPTKSFVELVAQVKAETLGALQHQDLPFEQLVLALAPARSLAHSPLFQVMFNHQRRDLTALGALGELRVAPLDVEQYVAPFDLTLDTWELGASVRGAFTYATDLFDEATIAQLAGNYRQLLAAACAAPQQRVALLPLEAAPGAHGATGAVAPLDTRTLPQLIAAQIAQTPDAVAVRHRGRDVSYAQLGRRAAKIARALRERGVQAEDLVGLCVERSPRLVAGALGVLAAGGAYVPLDPDYPRDRLAYMIGDAKPRVIVTEAELAVRFADSGAELLIIDDSEDEADLSVAAAHPARLAYCIYTSGSTGRPKGVTIPHAAIVNFLDAMRAELPLSSDDRFLAITPISFDIAGLELFLPLVLGARVVVATRDEAMDPDLLLARVRADEVTVVQATPSTWRMITGHPLARQTLRRCQLLCGGEALPPDLAAELVAIAEASGGHAWNVYGPTETTVWSSIARLSAAHPLPFLGEPLRNTTLHVLDAAMQPVPLGVAGELYIGGDGLARGYYQRPELTAERFIPNPLPDPFSTSSARLYRTGDLVRRRRAEDGSTALEYLGRVDHQIKLRGHRIELGEIEARLSDDERVRAAAVVLREDRLVAYVVPHQRSEDLADDLIGQLRARLAELLPDIMVPSAFVVLDELPRSPAGKLDRRALLALAAPDDASVDQYVAPRTPLEQQLAAIWAQALGVDVATVGLRDGFFDRGGHSLLAARVTSRVLKELGVAVPLRALFEAPALGAFAARVQALLDGPSAAAAPAVAIPRADRGQPLPLSFAQERQWFLWKLEPESAAYHMPAALELRGPLDVAALARAFTALAERHEILRTRFAPSGTHQIIDPPAAVALPVITTDDVAVAIAASSLRPFDLERGPLWRVELYRNASAADHHVLLVVLHHAIGDEGSMHVMIDELRQLYAGAQPPPLSIQYADFAAWQRQHLTGAELSRQLAYWKQQLGTGPDAHPVLELPADRLRPTAPSGKGAVISLVIDARTTRALRRLARQEDATLFHLLLAGFSALVYRFTQDRQRSLDLRVGVPAAQRDRVELERLIGFFINTHVLRVPVSGGDRFSDVVARVKEAALGAAAHAELPFEQLVVALSPPRSTSHTPLFQVLFNHLERAADPASVSLGEGLTLAPWEVQRPTAQFDLSVDTAVTSDASGETITAQWSYATDLFDEGTIAQLASSYRQLLASIASVPHGKVERIPIAFESLLRAHSWNDTARDHQLGAGPVPFRGFAERFAERAAKTPDAVALRHGAAALSYGELARRAHRVAWALAERGVVPGDFIGVYAERGLDQIATIVGVLAAGAVYVALDVRHPDERVAHLVTASGARLVITGSATGRALPAELAGIAAPFAALLDEAPREDAPHLPAHPEQLAYVIYTSGSTGVPKGAMVTMAGMLNNQLSKVPYFGLTPDDVIAQTAHPSFDISVWQMLTGLLCGAPIYIVPDDVLGDPRALLAHVRQRRVTILESVPSLIAEMVHDRDEAALPLRYLLPTGEALSPELARQWLRRFPAVPLVNAYGPAECADDVAMYRVNAPPAAEVARMPIGAPTDNTRLYVVDEHLVMVPIGAIGQLACAGTGVGHGYLADPARTAAVFVPNPYGQPGERLYLTGDLARRRADGVLEYVGRADHQIKLRGHRIELGEIEARLLEQPGVTQAAVILRQDAPGQPRLVAYVVAATEIAAAELRAGLAAALPEAMVPSAFVALPTLPLSPNGKLDRRALLALGAPDDSGAADRPYLPPQTAMEIAMAAIWRDVLSVERAGLDDNFFDLGGHSLLATRVTSRLAADLGVELPLRALFEAPTLAALAARAEQAARPERAVAEITPVDRARPLPLSFAQERQWFLWKLEPESSAYHIPMAARLRGPLDRAALERAFTALAARHESLRTRFIENDGEIDGRPMQLVEPSLPLPFTISSNFPDTLAAAIATRFDLERGPLWRIALCPLGADEHALIVVLHHIIADEVSLRLLMDEFAALYAGADLPPLTIHYADYASWQRQHLAGPELARQLTYWKQTLGAEHPVIELPTDHPRPPAASGKGALLELSLDAELSDALRRLARQHDATLFMVLLAGFQALLYRVTGQTDLRVGVPNANRPRLELERLIGFFINTHVLRAQVAPTRGFSSLLAQVKEASLAAQAHGDLPFEQLVEAINPPRSMSHTPLFQVMFNYLWGERDRSSSLAGLTIEPLDHARTAAQFDLSLDTWEEEGPSGREIRGALTYATDLFDEATIARLLGHYRQLLGAIALAPEKPLGLLPLLTVDEYRAHVEELAMIPFEELDRRGLHQLIAAQAVRSPDAAAVRHFGADVSYAALMRRARRLAKKLRALGCGPDELIGVCLERTPLFVASALGILEVGGIYAPLDPEYPRDRLAYMLSDARPRVLVTEPRLAERFAAAAAEAGITLFVVEAADLEAADLDADDATAAAPDALLAATGSADPSATTNPARGAYCIYTSGSTGRPKGAIIPHGAIVNHLEAMRRELRVVPTDRVLGIAPFAFDISVLEVFLPLISGACVVVATRAEAMDPALLLSRVRQDQIGIVQGTPATWRMITSDPTAAETLRDVRMLSGGEALPPDLADQLISFAGRMCNAYGPTETTVYSTAGTLDPAHNAPMLGLPLRNNTIYVLDRFLQPVPVGVIGEIYIGGDALARGYHQRPELTAEKFIPDHFAAARGLPGQRLYRSGDLGRRHPDGSLECVGRADFQVKLRGHRIELGEIEARLLADDAVRVAAVILRQDVAGQPRLVAYVVPAQGAAAALDTARLQDVLRAALPAFMVPQWFVALDEMPRSPSGKLDRRALPAPESVGAGAAAAPYVAPQDELEAQLAAIWAEVLGVERIGRDDHFFELGGHSLIATRITARVLKELGVAVPLRALFEASQLAGFAARVRALLVEKKSSAPMLARADRGQPLPLSFAQERQWFLWQLDPETSAYHVPMAVRLRGALDGAALEAAFAALTARHEILRTRFSPAGLQLIDEAATAPLTFTDFTGLDEDRLHEAAFAELEQPFDLKQGPLWRARLYQLGADEHALLIVMHHAISDEASLRVMIAELGQLYVDPRALDGAPLAIQYADYAAWQRGWLTGSDELARQLAYWKTHLGNEHPVLELPADRPRPPVASAAGAALDLALDGALTEQLEELARAHHATVFMVVLAAFNALLYRLTGQTDLRVGVPSSHRDRVELERLIGFFVNTHVLRTQVAPRQGFASLLSQVKEAALGAAAHGDLPFEQLVEVMKPPRSMSHSPLFQVMFNHLGALGEDRERTASLPGLALEPIELPRASTQFDLSLTTWREEAGLRGTFTYATDLFDEATVAQWAGHFEQLLRAIAADPERAVERLALTAQPPAGDVGLQAPLDARNLYQLFAEQAVRSPDAVAARHAGRELSYAELHRRALALAAELRARGVGPDTLVGVSLERTELLLVGLLGVLAAGGAYVPLDPDYPRDRLAYMIGDAKPRVIVTAAELAVRFADTGAELLPLALGDSPEATIVPSLAAPHHLAYCIYTSGSTGRPKGVTIPHAAIVNFLDAMRAELPLSSADRFLAITPISFDIAGLELFLPLVLGARVVVATREEAMDPGLLLARIRDEDITLIQATPATWRMLASHERAAETLRGRRLLCGGEALPPDLAAQLVALSGDQLWNVYGPTETTVWSTIARLSAEHPLPFLGKPLRNTTLHILDGALQPVPLGVAGELYLGGDGLARGYYQRPELTAERFIPNPLPDPFSSTGARLYRTGDLVRRRRDGSLEYLSRVDHQIKLRGHRIELGEIEARLSDDDRVASAVVLLREERLVAYVVPTSAATDLDGTSLLAALRGQLPEYMIPQVVVALPALPLSPAGKVDRRALAALPAPEARRARELVPPRDDLERRLAALWREVLAISEDLGVHDGFFDLGGHSLSATRLASRLRDELAVEIPLRVLFEATTVAELADVLRAGTYGAISDDEVDAMSDVLDLLENS